MIQIDEHTFEMDWSNHQLEGVDGIQVTFFCFCFFVYLVVTMKIHDVVGVLKLVNDKEVEIGEDSQVDYSILSTPILKLSILSMDEIGRNQLFFQVNLPT